MLCATTLKKFTLLSLYAGICVSSIEYCRFKLSFFPFVYRAIHSDCYYATYIQSKVKNIFNSYRGFRLDRAAVGYFYFVFSTHPSAILKKMILALSNKRQRLVAGEQRKKKRTDSLKKLKKKTKQS